jgi:hypothetical protein
VQREGTPIETIRPGDIVWLAPDEKHWHGATPTTGMSHIATQEKRAQKAADWLQQVSDERYGGGYGSGPGLLYMSKEEFFAPGRSLIFRAVERLSGCSFNMSRSMRRMIERFWGTWFFRPLAS